MQYDVSTCFTPLHTGQPSLLACQPNSYLNIPFQYFILSPKQNYVVPGELLRTISVEFTDVSDNTDGPVDPELKQPKK